MDARALDRLYATHVAELSRRYAETLAARGLDAVILHSGRAAKRTSFDDQSWPLRPVPHWQHWLPLEEPDCALVVRAEARPTLIRARDESFWEKRRPPETLAFLELFECVEGASAASVREHLPTQNVALVAEDVQTARAWGVPDEALNPAALVGALDRLRTIKTDYEVACLAEANRRARAGHEALRDSFVAGDASELELHLLYLRATAQDDAETPYKNIVALNEAAATLHHVAYGRSEDRRELQSLLVDAGATCRGYGADVTRIWVKGRGERADAFRQLVKAMDDLQQQLCARVRAGDDYERVHDDSHFAIAAALRDAGIVKASVDEAVGAGVTRAFFPHGLGHSLGLQTHDVGCGLRVPRENNPFLRNTSRVEVGQVFTIEPGVYFIEKLLAPLRVGSTRHAVDWSRVEALSPFGGVRIEDDVHVVGEGAPVRNLTREHLA